MEHITGYGLIERDAGREPPKMRALLKIVGDEPVTSLTLWKTPIAVSKFLNFITAGQYKKSLQKAGYDNLMHLAININGKYNLDKQMVLTFTRGSVKGETHPVQPDPGMTINSMLYNTKMYMGNEAYTSYNTRNNNCQDFMLALLSSNRINTPSATLFIKQDVGSILKDYPSYIESVANIGTKAQAILNRQFEGEGAPVALTPGSPASTARDIGKF